MSILQAMLMIRTLARGTIYKSAEKKEILTDSFFNAQLNCFPLI